MPVPPEKGVSKIGPKRASCDDVSSTRVLERSGYRNQWSYHSVPDPAETVAFP